MSVYDIEAFLKTINKELIKQGTSLEQVKSLHLAYPHKHPLHYPKDYNVAKYTVKDFKEELEKRVPHIQWKSADEICETVQLGRAEDQSSTHALTARQTYEIYRPAQKNSSLFIKPSHQGKAFFVIVDTQIEQGTTVANLMSYIGHNKGDVLAIAVSMGLMFEKSIAQKATASKNLSLSKKFNDAARNTGRLPEMAKAFSDSAKKSGLDWSPAYCMDIFEEKLKKCGNSVFALTDGECRKLINTTSGFYTTSESFISILEKLDPQFEATVTQPREKSSCAPETPAIS